MKATYRGIWQIAGPVIGGSLAQNMVSLADTYFLGRLGTIPLAAGAIGALTFMVLGFIGLGLGSAIQILTARTLGSQKPDQLPRYLWSGSFIAWFLGTLLALGILAGGEKLLSYLLASPEVQKATLTYLLYRCWELPATLSFWSARGFYAGIARTRPTLYANALLAFLNLLLNALFVFVWQWDIRGIAIASAISQYVATLFLYAILVTLPYRLPFTLTLSPSFMRPLARLSGPIIVQNFIGMLGWLLFFNLIEKMGSSYIAAANITRALYSFAMLPTWGFSTAVSTLVSYFYARHDPHALHTTLRRALTLSLSINTLSMLLLLAGSKVLPGFFTQDTSLHAQVQKDLIVVGISLVWMVPSVLFTSATIALGHTVFAMVIEGLMIGVYLSYTYGLFLAGVTLTVLWTAEWMYWVPTSIIFGTYFYKQYKKIKVSAGVL
ncbi:MAG: MATE family efflux transporter [Bacteroidia bacterium]